MKAKVIIEDGLTSIELVAENSFERDMIESYGYEKETEVKTTVFPFYNEGYGVKSQHKIMINLRKIKQ